MNTIMTPAMDLVLDISSPVEQLLYYFIFFTSFRENNAKRSYLDPDGSIIDFAPQMQKRNIHPIRKPTKDEIIPELAVQGEVQWRSSKECMFRTTGH